MKAVYLTVQGGPEVLTYGDRPEPKVQPDEILIKVRATALNHLDVFTRAGQRGTKREFKDPFILGCDIAGEVADLGPEVKGFNKGDHVIVNPGITCGRCKYCVSARDNMCYSYTMIGAAVNGGYAQFAKAPQENVHKIINDIPWEEAAAIPLTFITAWHMLISLAQLKPGEDVLIQAAGSGVGSAALQISKLVGARAIVTAGSDEKLAKAKKLGADETINYSTEDFGKRAKELTGGDGVDVVFDHIGTSVWDGNFAALKRGGRLVNCGVTSGHQAQLHIGQMFTKQVKLMGSFMGTKADMNELVRLVNQRKLHGVVSQVFDLKDAAAAHKAMEDRNVFGKLVLRVP